MKLISKNTWAIVGAIFLLELISFLGYFYSPVKIISAVIIALIVFVLTFKKLEFGILLLFAELIIGSKGHLFEVGPISIRMIIFSAIILAYLVSLFNKEEHLKLINNVKEFKLYGVLAFFVIVALLNGLLIGNTLSNVFSDFNAWLFFGLIFPISSIYFRASSDVYNRLTQVVVAAFLWLGIETFAILYVFTHNLSLISDLYLWLRRTGVAEITPTLGSWPRIFIQSQIYAAMALAILPFISKIKKSNAWILMIVAWSVVLLSMSRSFWLACVLSIAIGMLAQLIFKGWKSIWPKILLIVISAAGSVALILVITIFPIPKPGNFSVDSFMNRVSLDSNEAAVASRWSLLPAMEKEIAKNPVIGFGYGKTITYKSSDPRVLQTNPSGEYTTYAFEWGYLGLWLKLGLFGLLSYLALIFWLVYRGLKMWQKGNELPGALALGVIVLAIINFFTPYLDHPLGIGYLLLASCLIEIGIYKNGSLAIN